jgi:hypothetical protein
LWKVERRKISRAERRYKFSLKTGIFVAKGWNFCTADDSVDNRLISIIAELFISPIIFSKLTWSTCLLLNKEKSCQFLCYCGNLKVAKKNCRTNMVTTNISLHRGDEGYGISHNFQQYFSYIVAVSFIGGGNRHIQRKPSTCRKSLTKFLFFYSL